MTLPDCDSSTGGSHKNDNATHENSSTERFVRPLKRSTWSPKSPGVDTASRDKPYELRAEVYSHQATTVQLSRGASFTSRQMHAFGPTSLVENLRLPARIRIIDGSRRRVTTALRVGSDAAIEHCIILPDLSPDRVTQ